MYKRQKERFDPARKRRNYIMESLSDIPGVQIEAQPYSYHVIGLRLTLDRTPEATAKIVDQLKKGDPSIWVRYIRENTILVNTLFLDDGDEKVIVDRVKELLSR